MCPPYDLLLARWIQGHTPTAELIRVASSSGPTLGGLWWPENSVRFWVSTISVRNPEIGKSYLWEFVLERSSFSENEQLKPILIPQR
jgi:hypothetical protein